MKYIIILGDGMADLPDKHGRTPLNTAKKPNINALARRSLVGEVCTVPKQFAPGSDVANLSVLGYDPEICYTGRSPLEAASLGIALRDGEICYRANLVRLSDEADFASRRMLDYSAGEIATARAHELVAELAPVLASEFGARLHPGTSYRHCLVRQQADADTALVPPHDISGRVIADYLPSDPFLRALMQRSAQLLKGQADANSLWIWGAGTKPSLRAFDQIWGIRGAVISAVDLLKGIGLCAQMSVPDVPGATGTIHTDFQSKVRVALQALAQHDFVFVHIEAPDECGHQGDFDQKTRAIELLDSRVVGPLCQGLQDLAQPYRILLLPDHATPVALRTHTHQPVPWMLFDSQVDRCGCDYDEASAAATGLRINRGTQMMGTLLSGQLPN